MKKLLILVVLLATFAHSGLFEKGKKIFLGKCSVCHTGYIDPQAIKENFFEKNNTVLMLGAPSENMLVYAIMKGPKHIGDPSDPDMQQVEIEEYLSNILYHPKRENSICDPEIMKYYDIKKPIKDKLSDDEISALARFFMEYKKHRKSKNKQTAQMPKVSDVSLSDMGGMSGDEMLRIAKKQNKNIIIEASSPTCHYCKKMKKEVIDTPEVKKLLRDGYIFQDINIEANLLPFNLNKHYKHITPSFFVVDQNGKLLSSFPGSLTKSDFISVLKHFKPKGKK